MFRDIVRGASEVRTTGSTEEDLSEITLFEITVQQL